MKIQLILLTSFLLAIVQLGCTEDDVRAPRGDGNDKTPPQEVTDVTIKNIPGGAILKYNLPEDSDLLYIKAVFESKKGEIREVRASMYSDSIKIVGIGDTNERQVRLYAVDRAENASPGISVTINPETPAVILIRESLVAIRDWGGFLLSFENEANELFSVEVYYENAETSGTQLLHEIYYSEKTAGKIAVRGLKAIDTKFFLKVKDRWDNISETLQFDMKPIKEEWINPAADKYNFKELFLAGDVRWTFYGGQWARFFDNDISQSNYAHTDYPAAFPHRTTIDLGSNFIISRMKLWQRPNEPDFYKHACPREFKIYVCADGLDPYIASNYVELMHTFLNKPSGGEFLDPNTADDIREAWEGHEFPFPSGMAPIRYIRFESLASWSGMDCTRISELKFWGDDINAVE